MTPVVLSMAMAVVAAVAVLLVVSFLTGEHRLAPKELVASMRSGLERPRETFTLEDDVDGPAGDVQDVFVIGRDEPDVPRL